MKLALLGDAHLGARSGDPAMMDFQFDWLLKHFIPAAKAAGVQAIIQPGDFLDVRAVTSNLLLHRLITEFVPAVEESGIPWILTVGNHNIFYRDRNHVHNLKAIQAAFSDGSMFQVVEEWHEIGSMAFCGWLNKNNEEALLKRLMDSKVKYLFGHFEPEGFPLLRGVIAKDGMSLDMFSHFDRVFSGHYHTIHDHKNFQMLGSPYHITWSDVPDGVERGWWLFDSGDGTCELQRNKPEQTMFVTYEYNPQGDYGPNGVDTTKMRAVLENRISKIMIKDRGTPARYTAFRKALTTFPTIDFKIIDESMVEVEKVVIDEAKMAVSPLAVLFEYIDKQPGQETGFIDNVKAKAQQIFTTVNMK